MLLRKTKRYEFTGRWSYRSDGIPELLEVVRVTGAKSILACPIRRHIGFFRSQEAAVSAIQHHIMSEGIEQ